MEIREITGDKRRYLPLLLVGDEQEEMVMRYLPHGSLFVCFDPDPCAVAVVTDEGDGCCELKNLAVEPCRQRQGYGRRMVAFVVRRYTARGYRTLRVGTGETPSTLSFYAQCGFRPAGRIPDFFTRNYDHPIVEEGVLLRDMICSNNRSAPNRVPQPRIGMKKTGTRSSGLMTARRARPT